MRVAKDEVTQWFRPLWSRQSGMWTPANNSNLECRGESGEGVRRTRCSWEDVAAMLLLGTSGEHWPQPASELTWFLAQTSLLHSCVT